MLREQLQWLIQMEEKASQVYSRIADFFAGDKETATFIRRLEKDEELHAEMLRTASAALDSIEPPAPSAYLEPEEMKTLMDRFSRVEALIEAGNITDRELLEFVVDAEYSEWNELFLYIIASLKMKKEFKRAAVNIQKHKKIIEEFVNRNGYGEGLLDKVKRLPPVWEEKVLAVDDDEIITDVVEAVLCGEAKIDIARNGAEALKKLETSYYAAIITDMDMPLMDGVAFYKEAAARYPNIKKRFIFFSGSMRPELASFIGSSGIKFLKKPFSIKDIKSAVIEILNSD